MTTPERLPCEVEFAALLAQVADDEQALDPEHQRSCAYCQATLRRLRGEWADVQALAREPVVAPHELVAKIMARVRTLASHAADSVLLGHSGGETRISYVPVSRAMSRVTGTVPGVAFASVKVHPHSPSHPRRIGVTIRIAVTFGSTITQVAAMIREVLRRRIPTLTGAEPVRIDIIVDDIVDRFDQ